MVREAPWPEIRNMNPRPMANLGSEGGERMRRRVIWLTTFLGGCALVAATAGAAGAKPPQVEPAAVELTMLAACEFNETSGAFEAISVEATANALNESTKVDHISISLGEFRFIGEAEARAAGYFPYSTTLDVARWEYWDDLAGVPIATLSMATDDGDFTQDWEEGNKNHFWNAQVAGEIGEIDPESWFEAQAWTHASSTTGKGKRGSSWADDQARIYLQCAPISRSFDPASWPWDDWNYPDEP